MMSLDTGIGLIGLQQSDQPRTYPLDIHLFPPVPLVSNPGLEYDN
jgi:hypothetical protein